MSSNDMTVFNATAISSTTRSDVMKVTGPTAAVQSTWDVNTPTAKTFGPGTLQVQGLTFLAGSSTGNGDFIVLTDLNGLQWALGLVRDLAATRVLTFLAKASCVAGDFVVLYDTDGLAWGLSVNKAGTDAQPTAKAWTDIPAGRKAHVDISAATTAAQVAAAFELAADALTDWPFATDDSAADGTMIVTNSEAGPVSSTVYWKAAAGVLGGNTPLGVSIVPSAEVNGFVALAEPASALWTAIPAARKDVIDVTGLTAIEIAEDAEVALEALTGFTAQFTYDDGAGDGSATVTLVQPGLLAAAGSYTTAGAAGSVVSAITTPGVFGANIETNAAYTAAHGFVTGLKVRMTTSAADLPNGLALLTDYYLIKVDANQYKFATSLANALAGTAIDLLDGGSGTHTVTAEALSASVKLQASNDGITWFDLLDGEIADSLTNSQTISADGSYFWRIPATGYNYLSQLVTMTGGQLLMTSLAVTK